MSPEYIMAKGLASLLPEEQQKQVHALVLALILLCEQYPPEVRALAASIFCLELEESL